MAETLKTFEVVPEDIAETFKPCLRDSWERYKYEVENWYLRGLTSGEAAQMEGHSGSRRNPQGYQEYQHFLSYFKRRQPKKDGGKGKTPHQAKTIGALHHVGVFPGKDGYLYDEDDVLDVESLLPFNANNPRFRALALLSGLQVLEGSMGIKQDGSSSVAAYFSTEAMHDSRMIRFLEATMGTPLDPEKTQLLINGHHARLLKVLGNHIGDPKQQTKPDFPRPLMAALRTLSSGKGSEPEIALARQIISDFVLSIFGINNVFRLDETYSSQVHIHSPLLPDRGLAEDRARLFLEVLAQSEIVGNSVTFGPYEGKKPGFWFSTLRVSLLGDPEEQMEHLKATFFERLDTIIKELETD